MAGSDREQKRRRGLTYLILIGVAALVVVGGLIAVKPFGGPLSWIIRGAALLGYLAVFLSVVSSAYMRRMFLIFGRPFVKVHHVVSVAGLILITLHPLGAALSSGNLGVFLPSFASWNDFLRLGGRPAWYLIGAAALAAVLRKNLGQNWRMVHFLNYVAFLLASIHAIMIGTDFTSPVMKGIAGAMTLAVVAIFVQKRLQRRKIRRRKRA